jgi:hypothetical protein
MIASPEIAARLPVRDREVVGSSTVNGSFRGTQAPPPVATAFDGAVRALSQVSAVLQASLPGLCVEYSFGALTTSCVPVVATNSATERSLVGSAEIQSRRVAGVDVRSAAVGLNHSERRLKQFESDKKRLGELEAMKSAKRSAAVKPSSGRRTSKK